MGQAQISALQIWSYRQGREERESISTKHDWLAAACSPRSRRLVQGQGLILLLEGGCTYDFFYKEHQVWAVSKTKQVGKITFLFYLNLLIYEIDKSLMDFGSLLVWRKANFETDQIYF